MDIVFAMDGPAGLWRYADTNEINKFYHIVLDEHEFFPFFKAKGNINEKWESQSSVRMNEEEPFFAKN